MRLTRREVLKAAGVLGLLSLPRIWLAASGGDGAPAADAGVLVVLQLTGGNDSLNTLIPFRDDVYYRARPRLAIPREQVLPLERSQLGLHPALAGMRELYDDGALAVLPGVGYPRPDRSHFRSMDIWHSGDPEQARSGTAALDGWLGAVLDERCGALHVGDEQVPLALSGPTPVASFADLSLLQRLTTPAGRQLRDVLRALHAAPRQGAIEETRRLAQLSMDRLERLIAIAERDAAPDYPDNLLGQRLRLTGQLIGGGFPSRIYYLAHDGFDTHARQDDTHSRLLSQLGDGLAAFRRHLRQLGRSERVTVLVFSEFGRRVAENGSFGTDHGAAGTVFLAGDGVRGGLHGAHPSLDELDEGDLRHRVDFRCVYSTLLEGVLGKPSPFGARFPALPCLR